MAQVKVKASGWYNALEWDLYKQHKDKGIAGLQNEIAKLGIELIWENGQYYAILEEKDLIWLRIKYE